MTLPVKLLVAATLLCAVPLSMTAHAGGLFLPVRGVRPAARGGAFVAGADDPQALWYNPAGLAAMLGGDTHHELLIDAAYVGHDVSYTRIDSGGNTQPAVTDDAQLTALPTIAAEIDLRHNVALGFGLLTPYAALDGYPDAGAQRYALISMHQTLIMIVEAALAWQVNDRLRVGAGVQDMIVRFHSRSTFSTCPGQTLCAPEDPEWDATGEVDALALFTPSFVVGAQLRLVPSLTLGAAFQMPFSVATQGTVKVRLPSSGFYNGASMAGDRADVSLTFPAMARVGLEYAPSPRVHVELGFDWDMWSMQDQITVTPRDVRVENAAGVGTYDLGPIVIPRKFEDTFALRLGVEAQVSAPLTLRAGYVYETGAAPDEYLSVLTVDAAKHVVTAGLGFRYKHTRFDATIGHVFVAERDVPRGTSCAPQINPIRSGDPQVQPPAGQTCVHDGDPNHVYIGDGTYQSSWNIFGVGMTLDF